MEQEKQTIKQLQELAKKNGFYLCPEKVIAETWNTIEALRKEVASLRKRRDELKKTLKDNKTNLEDGE